MACIMIVGVVYGIIVIYSQILNQVASTNKYSQIDNQEDEGQSQPLMKSNNVNQKKNNNNKTFDISLGYNPYVLFQ